MKSLDYFLWVLWTNFRVTGTFGWKRALSWMGIWKERTKEVMDLALAYSFRWFENNRALNEGPASLCTSPNWSSAAASRSPFSWLSEQTSFPRSYGARDQTAWTCTGWCHSRDRTFQEIRHATLLAIYLSLIFCERSAAVCCDDVPGGQLQAQLQWLLIGGNILVRFINTSDNRFHC